MSNPPPIDITRQAPAKLNLGLEVLGRRDDGYHDLATIFLAVDLCDVVTLTRSDRLDVRCSDSRLEGEANLVWQALRLLQREIGIASGARVVVQKQIPDAAGLGGASSDAAAALLGARELWQLAIPDNRLAMLAGTLGSDVPFFLLGGCALGRGRGELLEPLPFPTGMWFVIVVPPVHLPRKTATLYAALRPEDFSPGDRISAQARRLRSGQALDPALLGNAFCRPLLDLAPALRSLPDAMTRAGAPLVALSGAGPAHYSVVDDPGHAARIAANLRAEMGNGATVFVVAPWQTSSPVAGRYDGA